MHFSSVFFSLFAIIGNARAQLAPMDGVFAGTKRLVDYQPDEVAASALKGMICR